MKIGELESSRENAEICRGINVQQERDYKLVAVRNPGEVLKNFHKIVKRTEF